MMLKTFKILCGENSIEISVISMGFLVRMIVPGEEFSGVTVQNQELIREAIPEFVEKLEPQDADEAMTLWREIHTCFDLMGEKIEG